MNARVYVTVTKKKQKPNKSETCPPFVMVHPKSVSKKVIFAKHQE
jgi:hypothetical protein